MSGLSKKVKMTSLRGRVFQAKIGSHECLVVPALAPAMLRSWGDKRYEGIDASEHWKAFYRDLKLAKKVAQDPPEWGRVEVTKAIVSPASVSPAGSVPLDTLQRVGHPLGPSRVEADPR